ncbi:hypothetical protein OAA09_00695 [bacterium]|nr:hypothetical protein [bacterium]
MIRFPTKYIVLEGPDLSGKTTFYNSIHKASNYRWNIHDRSSMSMIIHADQYDRDPSIHVNNFRSELMNLNNRYIIMLPPFEDIVTRYSIRGDEIQSLDNIKNLYKNFKAFSQKIINFPNVFVLNSSDLDFNTALVNHQIDAIETGDLTLISNFVKTFVSNTKHLEATPLSFTLWDDGTFDNVIDESIMDYEPEREYYQKIYTQMIKKIRNEMKGKNVYNREESVTSRRFIYTNDSCISLVQASYRENILDMHFVLRSSEVKTTFPYDLKFLYFLTSRVYKELQLIPKKIDVRMRFSLNSAHILV